MKNNNRSRKYYVIKNAIIGIINKLLVILLAFFSRTIFIKFLGAEYLGINGLYSNILSVLSLTELGIGSVFTFSLYKPLEENDEGKINALLFFYKKLYIWIALFVFFIGILIIPNLKYIVKSTLNYNELIVYYIIFLLNSTVSYLGVYKSTLLKASQKQYIVDTICTISRFIVTILQIISLIMFKNFILYLVIMVAGTIIQNLILTIAVNKNHNIIKSNTQLIKEQRNEIIKNIKSTFLYKIGTIIINYTDNILISILSGTVYVGYYSNYSMIRSQVQGFISILTSSLIASIGSLSIENNKTKSFYLFNKLVIVFHIISAFCSLCFLSVFNDFILMWLGKEYLLGIDVVFAITFSFYIQNIINPIWMYREAYGLFNEIKFLMLITALLNIIFSILLGKEFGISGIIIATAIARLLTTVWYEPRIIFDRIFDKKVTSYYVTQMKYFICTLLSYIILFSITIKIKDVSIYSILTKIILSFIIIIFMFSIFNLKNNIYISMIKNLIYDIKSVTNKK